jgi:hypothetical protein
MVDVVTAQESVAGSGYYLEKVVLKLQNADVDSSAAGSRKLLFSVR